MTRGAGALKGRGSWAGLGCVLGLLWMGTTPTGAQDEHAGHGGMGSTFGHVRFPISCAAGAQAAFDRGVAMLHSFFYPETEKAFRAAATLDPGCAMAYWGLAISQRPNPLTAPFSQELLKQGRAFIEEARTAPIATSREREWVEALAVFFEDHETVAQQARSVRYENAMARLHAKYPSDAEASVFYALALLEAVDLRDKTYGRQLKAARLLETLQKDLPEHPGIPHYLIHSYDYAPIAARGLPAARRYARLAPSAPHALHMPSHTFSTLGLWPDAIASNLAADAANRLYASSTNPAAAAHPASIAARYHALDFLENAYLQLGQDEAARRIVDERNSATTFIGNASITAHTGFAAIPVRFAFDRDKWDEAARLTPSASPFKQAEAITWFAKALGASRAGDLGLAAGALAELTARQQALAAAGDPYWAEEVGIQEIAAKAWVALAERRTTDALGLMRAAADREDRSEKHIAMENRLSPMRELLGEMLLQAGRPKDALGQFEASLRAVPNRRRSLLGAIKAAGEAGDQRRAEAYRKHWAAQSATTLPASP